MITPVKIYLFFIQFIGYLWNLILFIMLIPYLLYFLSKGLDFLVLETFLKLDYQGFLNTIPGSVWNLAALVVFVFGVMIIIETVVVLYKDAHAFPFTIIPHDELTPSQLLKEGWYAKVRHPMVLGYLITLIGAGIYLQSPTMVLWWVPLVGGLMLEYALMIEERSLVAWFGDEYQKYQKEVPPLIPRFGTSSKTKPTAKAD